MAMPNIQAQETGTLTVIYKNIRPNQGVLRTAIYDGPNFLKDGFESHTVDLESDDGTELIGVFENVEFGKIAISCYQDLNGDWKLSSNMLGIPSEPFGFSEPLESKWRAPKFDEVAIDFQEKERTVTVYINTWKEL